jgi:TrmH family RNA methyltransferase
MDEQKQVSSLQNALVRKVIRLKEKKKGRDVSGDFVLEGRREIGMALKGGYRIRTLLFYPGIITRKDAVAMMVSQATLPEFIEVSMEVYRRIAYREKTEGVLALALSREHRLSDLKFRRDKPLILIAEAPEKPGNIGALLRTADAANLDAVIIANPRGDLYNPNIIRSSVGCLFTVPLAEGSTTDVIRFLKKKNITLVIASLSASKNYIEVDYTPAMAIAVGTESTGLTAAWGEQADHQVLIPMMGEIDSMNVSVSAAILIFEARRQRGFRN